MVNVNRAEWRSKTTYDEFMEEQGVPIHEGWSVYDVSDLERKPWKRLGVTGAFIQLYGQEDITAMYVVEIPPHGALNVEKHMYEESYHIMDGSGSTEVWAPIGSSTMEAGP